MAEQPVEILLVEDNPHDAELTLRVLSRHQVANHVTWLMDGAQALEFLMTESDLLTPHLILLDLKLPKVDGLELLKAIRAHDRLRTIPVVMLTSSTEECDVVESYRLGVNSYIVKPVEFDAFAEAIRQVGLYWLLLNQAPGH